LFSLGLIKERFTTGTTQPSRETSALNNRYQKGQRDRERIPFFVRRTSKRRGEKDTLLRCVVRLPISSGSFRSLLWIQLLYLIPSQQRHKGKLIGSQAFNLHRIASLNRIEFRNRAIAMKPAVLGRSSSVGTTEPLPPSSRASLMRGRSAGNANSSSSTAAATQAVHNNQGTTNRAHKSKFKRALKRVEVPAALQQGIQVTRVFANGQKPKQQFLTLSRDKFTLHITSAPIHARHLQEKAHTRSGSWFSSMPSIIKRNSSVDSISCRGSVSGIGRSLEAAEGSRNRANKEVRAIDIGAIHRIQRGAHNANLKTTTTSAETVQNLTRRTRSDLK
jgi:hypothetical protein